MESKLKLLKENQSQVIILVLLLKLVVYRVSYADCLCAGVLLLAISAAKVIDYLYPKRPDLYTQLKELDSKFQELVLKNEDLERDVTAMKFEGKMR